MLNRRWLKKYCLTGVFLYWVLYFLSWFLNITPRLSKQVNIITTTKPHILVTYVERAKDVAKKPDLVIPKVIIDAVGANEWISRTITVSERQCPVVEKKTVEPKADSNMSCKIPNVDPFYPSIKTLLKDVSMPNCKSHKVYGKLEDGKMSFLDSDISSATYRRIVRNGDFKYVLGTSTPVHTSKQITDEFIEVNYLLKNGKNVKEIFFQPVPHEHLMKRTGQKKPGIALNILVITVDSLSRANAQRKLPKLYDLLKNEHGSFIFNGHSIVGDGTTEQLAAMLTGLGELEQYESRRHHRNPRPVDGWNWIYNQLKEHGYLTGYSADFPSYGPFQYRLMGFHHTPTDFYTRPFFLMANPNLQWDTNRCIGGRTVSKCQMDYIFEIFQMFRKKLKFFFSFNAQYSHNAINEAAMIEPDLLSFLQDFQKNGHLNNTLMIVMGDHGPRFGKVRELMEGKLEERLPLFAMTFPSWFKSRYPGIASNLRKNTDRLTSWYDVYATFRHMLSYPEVPSKLKHGKSLFEEIPLSRTCADATVEPHWCPCLEMSEVDVNHTHVINAALAAVEYINTLTNEHKKSAKYCQLLSLKRVNYALLEKPNDKLLAFKQTNDLIPAFASSSKPKHLNSCRYQLQILTSPNNAIYEVTVRYFQSWFVVSKSISRVNKYGSQPECIAQELPHLRKFCICQQKR